MRKRFYVWVIASVLVIILLVKMLSTSSPINTNIMDLLPKNQQNSLTEHATSQFTQSIDNKLVFLIGQPTKLQAQQAALQFSSILAKSAYFSSIQFTVSLNQQQAWSTFYFPYRTVLLTDRQRNLLLTNQTNQIVNQALYSLYSPSSVALTGMMTKDPYFLFMPYITSLPKPASNVGLEDNYMMIHANNVWYVLVNAELKGNSFSLSQQTAVTALISQAESKIHAAKFIKTGVLFYAEAGAASAQHDISTIGIGSLIGIILLILMTFRSCLPLIFTLMSSAIGFASAFVVTQLIFGSVDLFTLVFGASLIGISVDYAYFYYSDQLLGGQSWRAKKGLSNIISGISLGLINIVIAYLVLLVTPFPGLKQLSVFSMVGLIASFATVVCAFPMILKAKPSNKPPMLLKLTNCLLNFWKVISLRRIIVLYCIISVLGVVGLLQLRVNDNVQILQPVNPELKHNEHLVKSLIGSNTGMSFYVVKGTTPDQVMMNENKLTQAIVKRSPSVTHPYLSVSDYVPSLSQQKQDFKLVMRKLYNHRLSDYLHKIGMATDSSSKTIQDLQTTSFKAMTVSHWLNSPVSDSMRFLWLGKVDREYASIVLLSNQLTTDTLKSVAHQFAFATYVNKAEQVSSIFKDYRVKVLYLLAIAYLAFLLLLLIRYGFKNGVLGFIPVFAASILAMSVLGWLHIPLTLFNVLALFIVLGIGSDYVIFFAETKASQQGTMLAVSLSAITTILSFGLLAFSSTPVIYYFGVTVGVGIVSAYILSPMVTRHIINEEAL